MFAIKSEHIRFLQDFIAWPNCLVTGTTKTKTSRDRNGSDQKVACPSASLWTTEGNTRERWQFRALN